MTTDAVTAASAGTRELPPPPQQNGGITPAAVAALAEPTTPDDRIAEVHQAARAVLARAKEAVAAVEAAMVEHILANGGRPIVIGATEYRAGVRKETKNRKGAQRRTFAAILDATKGDVDAAADCLCSDPFKPATVRQILPQEAYADCFETVERPVLVEGKVKPQLIGTNKQFIGSKQ